MKRLVLLLTMWFGVLPAAIATGWSARCITPITLGQPVAGELTTTDCSWAYPQTPQHQYYTDVYSFTGTAGQQVSALLTSPRLNMYVEIYNVNDVNATPLAADDNGGGGSDARIPAGSGYFTLPASGTYYLWAQTADPDWTGAYTLTLTGASAVPSPATPNAVTVTEFYHPVFNHYFITAYPEEAASLTAGNLPPWSPPGTPSRCGTRPAPALPMSVASSTTSSRPGVRISTATIQPSVRAFPRAAVGCWNPRRRST